MVVGLLDADGLSGEDLAEIDLSPFDRFQEFRNVTVRPRSYVLSDPATAARYKLLRARFLAFVERVSEKTVLKSA